MRALLILLISYLTGCAATSKATHSRLQLIKPGITSAELIERIGQPNDKIGRGKNQNWYYSIYSEDGSREYPYCAKFRKGVLASFEPGAKIESRNKRRTRKPRAT